ncbi:IclR family transcriptional regulator [Bryobacterales bacterium F-183]|nr:IclR family transcriptional regulator [Bryobacterales bacterium F-183]
MDAVRNALDLAALCNTLGYTGMSSIPNATSVERALAILDALDNSKRGMNISELSRKLSIPKSSAHVIVVTLERLGYVERKPDSLLYHLGLKAYGLGRGMNKNLPVGEIALPGMRRLVDQIHLPAHLAVPDGNQGVYIQKVEAPGLIKFDTYIGRRMDLHCTGVGKVILTWGPAEIAEHVLSKPTYIRYTRNTITSPKALRRELSRARACGYAVDDEEEEIGVRCVAVPVFQPNGQFTAGLSVTGTTSQIPLDSIDALAQRLRQTAAGFFAAA